MNKVKAYYQPGEGWILIDPKGSHIQFDDISISDNYVDASSKVGTTRLNIGNTATISFQVEVVNEHPNKKMFPVT